MTWLPVNSSASTERAAVLGLQPEAYRRHQAFLTSCADVVDTELLELCRARMARTLGCREELARHDAARLEALDSPALSPLQRNALEFVDQFLIDPAIIGKALVAELENEMGTSGVVSFTTVISAYEASLRLSTLFDLAPSS